MKKTYNYFKLNIYRELKTVEARPYYGHTVCINIGSMESLAENFFSAAIGIKFGGKYEKK